MNSDPLKTEWKKLTVLVRPHRKETLQNLLRPARRSFNSWINGLIDLHLPELAAEAQRKQRMALRLAKRGQGKCRN
jgi:hypothetical protein